MSYIGRYDTICPYCPTSSALDLVGLIVSTILVTLSLCPSSVPVTHLTPVLLTMPLTRPYSSRFSIFTAFILEAFILEFTTERTTTESKVERKITELGLGLGRYGVRGALGVRELSSEGWWCLWLALVHD